MAHISHLQYLQNPHPITSTTPRPRHHLSPAKRTNSPPHWRHEHPPTTTLRHRQRQRPKFWPWLYNQVHPPNPDTTPRLCDLFRSQNPYLRQWTRPCNKRLPDSQSRIDLILAFTSFISIFNPQNTFINTSINSSDHYPVTSTINIPTNPLNIYDDPHADIYC